MHKNLKLIPANRLEKLSKEKRKVVEAYASEVKLKAVIRWKTRMAAAGITVQALAESTKPKMVPTRISEWLNFTNEPREANFLKVENAIYKLETK